MRFEAVMPAHYRFGFVLSTTIGNMTRYLNLRKYAERDEEVDFTWAPVSHYTPPGFQTRLRVLPGNWFMRSRVIQQAWPVLGAMRRFDAVMFHLYEADILSAMRGLMLRGPLRVSSTDDAPIVDRDAYPLYPGDAAKPAWRQKMRLAIDLWRVRRTDCFIPFSQWAADILVAGCGVPRPHVHPLHVGLDLEMWTLARSLSPERGALPRILFVGSDFERKGGSDLLDVFTRRFTGRAELHLVTRQAPSDLPPGVVIHDDYQANDPRFPALYASATVFVSPTHADVGPLWVLLEAMAMGVPVIGTPTGANSEVVRHGENGYLIPVGDRGALADALEAVVSDPVRARAMGRRGRAIVEGGYDASRNVPRILRIMKDATDDARARGRLR